MMTDDQQLFRMVSTIRNCTQQHQIDLRGLQVLTEAATGPYACTSVIAALAGAQVTALARPSTHGSVGEIQYQIGR